MGRTQHETLDVGPEDGRDYTEIELPEELARRTRVLVDLDEAPGTMGELARSFAATDTFQTGEAFTWQDLLVSEEPTRHEVRLQEGVHHTHCILDALVLPFLMDERVEILTRPPGSDEVIEILATPDRLEASPVTTVVSFGTSGAFPETPREVAAADRAGLLDLTHAEGCPAINAFPDEAAYRAWAHRADAATLVMTLAQAYTLAHDSARGL